jgi:ribonuclease P protein component
LTYLPHQSRPTAGRSTENRSAGGTACVAFALGRDIGGAVARNRLRRRLRAVCHDLDRAGELPPGAYLLRAGRPASELSFGDLARCVAQNVSAATTAST